MTLLSVGKSVDGIASEDINFHKIAINLAEEIAEKVFNGHWIVPITQKINPYRLVANDTSKIHYISLIRRFILEFYLYKSSSEEEKRKELRRRINLKQIYYPLLSEFIEELINKTIEISNAVRQGRLRRQSSIEPICSHPVQKKFVAPAQPSPERTS